jgi:outer membrane protein TolC
LGLTTTSLSQAQTPANGTVKRQTAKEARLNTPIDTSAQHLVLSLQQAQQYALNHSYALQNASLDVQKAETAKWQAISSMLPQVKAGFDYSNMCGYSMNMAGMHIDMNPYGTFALTTSVAVTGAQIVSVLLSNVSKQMSDVSRRQSIQSSLANVKDVYVSVLVMQETMSLLDSSLSNMERLQKTTNNAVAVGASEQVDADKLSVQVATLRNSINSNKRALQMLYNSLLLQLGANVNSTLELTTSLDDIIDINAASQMLAHGFDIKNNFTYQTLQLSEQAGKKQVTMAYMDYLPVISAYHQYNKKTYFGKNEGFNMTPPNMIGLSINWPIFQTGTRMAKVKEAKINYQETLNSKKQAEDALKVQYKQASFDMVNALETYNIQKENIDVTQRVFKNITEKYKYGRASSLEVTNANNDLINAQSNYIQAVISVVNAQVSLEKLLSEDQYTNVVLPGEKIK